MTQQIPVRIADEKAAAIDKLVDSGRFGSRSEVLRVGLDRLLADEREREIEEAYRRAGEAGRTDRAALGLAALAEWSDREGGEPL